MDKVTKETIVTDVLKMDDQIAEVFFKNGLYCLGCPSASGETIQGACETHAINSDKLVKELNEYLEKK